MNISKSRCYGHKLEATGKDKVCSERNDCKRYTEIETDRNSNFPVSFTPLMNADFPKPCEHKINEGTGV